MAQHVIHVIGGGIIGLACAVELRRSGFAVRLFDAAPAAREASWAAAGMLAPHNEAHEHGPLHQLMTASLDLWPQWLEGLGMSAEQVDYRDHGSLIPVLDSDDHQEVLRQQRMLSAAGIESHWLTGAELVEAEPMLCADAALWLPGAQVDPRRCSTALREAAQTSGVELLYATAVQELTESGLVTSDGERYDAEHQVLACGAWTPAMASLSGINLPGEPVKGQMVLLGGGGERSLRHFAHCRHAYCVPRADCGVVVGATMVCEGFDRSEDPEAIAELAAGARRLFPHLKEAPVVESWTGLRPRLQGGLPCIERVSDHLTIATGHFRNGILLTPITARLVNDLVMGRVPSVDATAFCQAQIRL